MRAITAKALLAACGLLAGCGGDPPRGNLTAAEERKLDEAAKMLDDNMIDVSPDSLGANALEIEAIEANQGAPAESPPGDTQ